MKNGGHGLLVVRLVKKMPLELESETAPPRHVEVLIVNLLMRYEMEQLSLLEQMILKRVIRGSIAQVSLNLLPWRILMD